MCGTLTTSRARARPPACVRASGGAVLDPGLPTHTYTSKSAFTGRGRNVSRPGYLRTNIFNWFWCENCLFSMSNFVCELKYWLKDSWISFCGRMWFWGMDSPFLGVQRPNNAKAFKTKWTEQVVVISLSF